MIEKFRIEVADIPWQDDLVAEIFYGGVQWVMIYRKNKELFIQFYQHPDYGDWEFPLDLAIQAIEKAKNRLIEVG